MRYFLALDLGRSYSNHERYKKIDLSTINPILTNNNNFKYLCNFTMEFNNPAILKELLFKKGLITRNDLNNDLVFCYDLKKDKNFVRYSLQVPYSCHKKYFNYGLLPTIIKDGIKSKDNYLDNLISYYVKDIYLSDGFFLLNELKTRFYTDEEALEYIRAFVKDNCYKNGSFSYRELHELAMLVATFDGVTPEVNPVVNAKKDASNLEQNIKFANLRDRIEKDDDLQMRLF